MKISFDFQNQTWNSIFQENLYAIFKGDPIFQNPSIHSTLLYTIPNSQGKSRALGFGFSNPNFSLDSILSIFPFYLCMFEIVDSFVTYSTNLWDKDQSLTDYHEKIQEDLEAAILTQKNILSLEFPENPLFRVTSFYKPHGKIGGDIISYHKSQDRIYVFFGDVSGHGISSAMISGMAVLGFKNLARLKKKPREILEQINIDLQQVVKTHHIAAASTLFLIKKRKLIYSYAGHPPIILIRKGNLTELEGMNSPLLTMERTRYFENELALQEGDRLVFFSDGCYEVFNQENQLLGYHRFLEILSYHSLVEEPKDFIGRVMNRISEYSLDTIRDDMAMLVIDIT